MSGLVFIALVWVCVACWLFPVLVCGVSMVHLREQVPLEHHTHTHVVPDVGVSLSVSPLSELTLKQALEKPSWKTTPTIKGFEEARLADYRRGFQTPGVHFKVDVKNAAALQAHFNDWLEGNAITYTGDELGRKFSAFKANLIKIQEHNSQTPTPDFLMHLGPFAALTFSEFDKLYLMQEHGTYNDKKGSGPQPPQPLNLPHCPSKTACAPPREVQGTVECQRHRVVEWCCPKGQLIHGDKCVPQAIRNNQGPKGAANFVELVSSSEMADSVGWDWEKAGVLSPIQWQAKCGSCWAFATTAAVEAAWAISEHGGHYTGDYSKPYKVDFPTKGSEQQVLDCTWRGNCGGGYPDDAFHYIRGNGLCQYTSYKDIQGGEGNSGDGGIKSEITGKPYPYTAETHSCHDGGSCGRRIRIDDYSDCRDFLSNGWLGNDATDADYIEACLPFNPVVVKFHVDDSFQHLKTGIYSTPCTGIWWTNHVMVIVGYGTRGGKKYWKVRNSWSTTWGDAGYGYIERGEDLCGIESAYQSIPLINWYDKYPTTFTGKAPPTTPSPPPQKPICPKRPPTCYFNGKCPGWHEPAGCPPVKDV